MTRYSESLRYTKLMPLEEVNPEHKQLDLSGLIKYAKSTGRRVCDLSEEEKQKFIK